VKESGQAGDGGSSPDPDGRIAPTRAHQTRESAADGEEHDEEENESRKAEFAQEFEVVVMRVVDTPGPESGGLEAGEGRRETARADSEGMFANKMQNAGPDSES
jgi:hypothetical protein